jgi:hypothetical protein
MDRTTQYVFVTWREREASIQCLNEKDFEAMRRAMIDEGFRNLQSEWYEPGNLRLPDRIVVFVYWEDPDTAPEYIHVKEWGSEVAGSNRG